MVSESGIKYKPVTVGERIRQCRKEHGFSAETLAEYIGKDKTTVYRYESGSIAKLPTEVLCKIAICLNTTPEYLLGLYDSPPPIVEKQVPNVIDQAKIEMALKLYASICDSLTKEELEVFKTYLQ